MYVSEQSFVCAVAVQSYQEKEQNLYVDLSTLIKDAAWLKHYIASALKVQGDALLGAASALGENTRPDASIGMSDMSLASREPSETGPTQREDSLNTAGRSHRSSSSGGTKTAATANAGSSKETNDGFSGVTSEGTTNPFLTSGVIPS